jgi:S1-C subfamily serine protease
VTYLLDEPPPTEPGAAPGVSPAPARPDDPATRGDRARRSTRRALPFVAGAAVMLAMVLGYGALQPRPEPLTRTDVREAIDSALASQTPGPPDAELVYAAVRPSVVSIQTESTNADGSDGDGSGTGVVVNGEGEVLTALHVVDEASAITLIFSDGSRTGGTITVRDQATDIAVVTPDSPPGAVVPAVLGNPSAMQIGSDAFIVGNPFGLVGSLSTGVVSGLERSFRDPDTREVHTGLIQVDAAVNPGNSGGPLVDRAGRVVGIVIALINPTEQEVFIGIGLAVPIDVAGGAAGLPNY